MDDGSILLAALHARPGDDLTWLAFADWLEESGRPGPAELARLVAQIRRERESPRNPGREDRVRALLAAGVDPIVPTVTNSVRMTFALIPPATFLMGSPPDEPGRYSDEEPLHPVTLTRAYYLGIHPVTQAQFQAVSGRNPSSFAQDGEDALAVQGQDTGSFPVESITWSDAVTFCKRLSDVPAERRARRAYRLPTEAEWEHACRGGIATPTPYHFGAELAPRQARHNFLEPLQERGESSDLPYHPCPAPVGSYRPNAFGLYDLHGQVWEYCHDWFLAEYYHDSPAVDPTGPEEGDNRVLRGGSWYSRPAVCRSACRNPLANRNTAGFRVVLAHPG